MIAGHYGSGKTELAVSLALRLSEERGGPFERLSVVDLDVANPYFRSRERQELLRSHGVSLYADTFGSTGTAAELPALTAALRAPLEDPSCRTLIDLGGNDAGARVLRQFSKYFAGEDHELWIVVNFRRYETRDIASAQAHVEAIEKELGIGPSCLVNNTHLLRETTKDILLEGHEKAVRLAEEIGRPLLFTCYPAALVRPEALENIGPLMPLGMYMRPSYLDK